MNIEDFLANSEGDQMDDALMLKEVMDGIGQYQDKPRSLSLNEESEPIISAAITSKKKAKRDVKTNFYFPRRMIDDAKIYCIKHHTTLTALINELMEERLYGNKEGSRNAGKKERRDNGKKE